MDGDVENARTATVNSLGTSPAWAGGRCRGQPDDRGPGDRIAGAGLRGYRHQPRLPVHEHRRRTRPTRTNGYAGDQRGWRADVGLRARG